jgi:hypothetical protein
MTHTEIAPDYPYKVGDVVHLRRRDRDRYILLGLSGATARIRLAGVSNDDGFSLHIEDIRPDMGDEAEARVSKAWQSYLSIEAAAQKKIDDAGDAYAAAESLDMARFLAKKEAP